MPAVNTGATEGPDKLGNPQRYTYNDGDGSTAYDVEYPLQMHGFDPNFHFVGMTFNPEIFVDMKDKYFLLNGRSYPDTVAPGPQASMSSDGQMHYSQPMPAIINIPVGGKALLRMVNLSVSEYHTLQSLGVPMKEVGFNAKLLRDQAGMNTEFYTNSITLGGGESLDVDSGCQRRRLRVHGLRGHALSGGERLLSLQPPARPSCERCRELRRNHDRGAHLHQRHRWQHLRQYLQLGNGGESDHEKSNSSQ